jgi:hypothetical protein
MKYLAILALAVGSIGLGACAREEPAYTTTTTTTAPAPSTGYSK